jgi:uncharacterized protein (DUF983 family)
MYQLPNSSCSSGSDSGAVVVVLILGLVLVVVVVVAVIFNPIRIHLVMFIPIFYVLYKFCSLFSL